MNDIFICYSSQDRCIATQLACRLREKGWSVFLDVNIDAGGYWSEEIECQLAAARAVLALWSSSSVHSRFVMDEAHAAAKRGVLFPARIEEVNIPYGFGIIHTLDLIGWKGYGENKQWDNLISSIERFLNGKAIRKPQFVIGRSFSDKLKLGTNGPQMMVIPEGKFLMGSPSSELGRDVDEDPQHEVDIPEPFAMGVYPVTFEDYDLFCRNTGRPKVKDEGWSRKKRPVLNVSWNEAQAYCFWLSEQTERIYRLPSEAEWEYACRAGTNTPFNVGQCISTEQANFNGSSTYNGSDEDEFRARTVTVGSFEPNSFGLYEMHGNVRDWCQDVWHENYKNAPIDGSAWVTPINKRRVVRGGAWVSLPVYVRSPAREWSESEQGTIDVGFRVVCSYV